MATTNGNMPIFARGALANVQAAIDAGTLKYPSYVVDPKKKVLIFIDKDNTPIVLDNNYKDVVQVVETLPAVADADPEVLYITTDGVYRVNPDAGTEGESDFINVDNSSAVEQLQTKVTTLETKVEQFVEQNAELVFASFADFPTTGTEGKLYIDESDNGGIYSWDTTTSAYLKLASKDNEIKFIELEEIQNEDGTN